MSAIPAIAIFDIGKTNKKLLVFDNKYRLLHEQSEQLSETVDEDGDVCEDVQLLTSWIRRQWALLLEQSKWNIRAVNVSAYGASFVHLNRSGEPAAPLYNYLKPLPIQIRKAFHSAYPDIWLATASPDLDNLNSGLQIFMVKHAKPSLFARIATSLHLPQYLAYVLNQRACSDLTSLGCHTAMWDFARARYASWVEAEDLTALQAPITSPESTVDIKRGDRIIYSGIGLHDSSAALIPYLMTITTPFCLLSTGTWSITLNPFNHDPLTQAELAQDCLCYLSYRGTAVKASRLFSGHFHDVQVRALSEYFNKPEPYYKLIDKATPATHNGTVKAREIAKPFEPFDPSLFPDYESAYVYLIEELVARQAASTRLVLSPHVEDIFVDGGFSDNHLFMTLLAKAMPKHRIMAASVAQASALGAALAIHSSWNSNPVPADLIKLRSYSA